MRKVKDNELEAYLFSFKLRSDGQLQVQCFSKKWHTRITENLEKGNLEKINENKFSVHQTSRIGPKPIK
jgi:sorbitol-specific phosphotransferase system component IIA